MPPQPPPQRTHAVKFMNCTSSPLNYDYYRRAGRCERRTRRLRWPSSDCLHRQPATHRRMSRTPRFARVCDDRSNLRRAARIHHFLLRAVVCRITILRTRRRRFCCAPSGECNSYRKSHVSARRNQPDKCNKMRTHSPTRAVSNLRARVDDTHRVLCRRLHR